MSKTIYDARLEARARLLFRSRNVAVQKSILGSSHFIKVGDSEIEIRLPKTVADNFEAGPFDAFPVQWNQAKPDDELETFCECNGVLAIKKLKWPTNNRCVEESGINNRSNYTSAETKQLDQQAERVANELEVAFAQWRDMLQWLSGMYFICQDVGPNIIATQRTNMRIDSADGKLLLWNPPITIIGRAPWTINRAGWGLVQEALNSNVSPPVWNTFINEAQTKIATSDYKGAVLSAAIACETVIRTVFWTNIQNIPNETVRQIIDKTNVQTLINNWLKLVGQSAQPVASMSDISALFNTRNNLMHSGVYSLTETKAKILISSSCAFINRVTDYLAKTDQSLEWPSKFRSSNALRS